VGVYLGWFGRATRLVRYGSALVAPLSSMPVVRRALDAQARRIQRSRAGPGTTDGIRSDVVAVARDASGKKLAAVHLIGADPTRSPRRFSPGRRARRPPTACGPRARSGRLKPSEPQPSKAPVQARDFTASPPNRVRQFTV
jgi:hypothetical protein